jgi:hypothetical protein
MHGFTTTSLQPLLRAHQGYNMQHKRQRFNDMLHEVAKAANRHDSFTVYQAVQKYAPKQPKKRIRLRMKDGTPASPDDVLTLTKEYIQEVWLPATTVDHAITIPTGVPFQAHELEAELAQIPTTKAVAGHCLSGICWKSQSKAITAFIYPLLQR